MGFQGIQDDYIGDEYHEENQQAYGPTVGSHHNSNPVSVPAGKFHSGKTLHIKWSMTLGSQNGKLTMKCICTVAALDLPNPGHHHQEMSETMSHYGHAVHRLADGHIVVIDHDNKDDDF